MKIKIIGSFFFALVLTGCYTGPKATTVINETCANYAKFGDYFDCFERNWYQSVKAAGYSGKSEVQTVMQRGRVLKAAVTAGEMTNTQARIDFDDLVLQMRRDEKGDRSSKRSITCRTIGPYTSCS